MNSFLTPSVVPANIGKPNNRRSAAIRLPALAVLLVLLAMALPASAQTAAETKSFDQATTVANPAIPTDQLELLLDPMTVAELDQEADAWFQLLRQANFSLSEKELAVKKKNLIIDKSVEASAPASSGKSATSNAEQATALKDEILDEIAEIRETRTELIDRLNLVLDEISQKSGLSKEGGEPEHVQSYRHYIKSAGGLKVDVKDTQSTWKNLLSWTLSKEGGQRWGKHILVFLSTIAGFWVLGIVLSALVKKALNLSSHLSLMLKKFIVTSIRRIMIAVGMLIGLTALEVNIGPLVAVIGATGFVVAFALQDTLGNFASGLMILLYRPFDVGDMVDVAGVVGKVRSMTLVTTTITTPDNKLMIVPNSSIWGNVITNSTGSSERRVDMVFGIAYESDIDKARDILLEILHSHEQVLDDPEAVVQVNELADSSVNFICRPWVKTEDYWPVYWDVHREVKLHFDAAGISIPFPQREVRLVNPLPVTGRNPLNQD